MMQLLAAGFAGMYTAAWGAYKDAPYERFSKASFWRSLAFSVGIALALHGRLGGLHAVEAFFLVMGLERLAIEIYKPCFRREDQSKYLIPQDFSFFGVHVGGRKRLWLAGAAMIALVAWLATRPLLITGYAAHLGIACAVGLFIACGGAAKDAPWEGFDALKFPRSIWVLALASPLLAMLGSQPLGLLVFMYGGVERMFVEGYKTYFTTKPPGKFRRDLPVIDHRFLAWRPVLRWMAIAIVTTVAAWYVAAVV